MFAAYHASNTSPSVGAVIDGIRSVVVATGFLLPLLDRPLARQHA
jgi:hypothetical protein